MSQAQKQQIDFIELKTKSGINPTYFKRLTELFDTDKVPTDSISESIYHFETEYGADYFNLMP